MSRIPTLTNAITIFGLVPRLVGPLPHQTVVSDGLANGARATAYGYAGRIGLAEDVNGDVDNVDDAGIVIGCPGRRCLENLHIGQEAWLELKPWQR